ncbi:GroES chaperonin [Trifolium medium]|uniref:GroES chaperonin n=1 Tax=Trifolium medium TaxID=97028 RepID=A0A392QVM0_9FABA|nr:GroES chaperonin [Trifolium medium]
MPVDALTFFASVVLVRLLNLSAIFWMLQVIAVGPGPVDDEGNRKPLSITPGNTVLYSKYAGNDFKGKDGSDYIALRASDVIAILS